jgi:peroxiredoxin
MDPLHYGAPFFVICAVAMFFVYLPRLLLFNEWGFLKFIWVDITGCFMVVAAYVTANVKGEFGWRGWVIPAFPVFYTVFKTMGAAIEYKQIKPLTGKTYKAGIEKEAPDFNLPDHDGKMVRLSDYRGKNSVLMIFVRGDWCPTCHITLRSYEKNRQKFQDNNVTVLSIGPDPVGVNHEMVKKLGVRFHILADETGEVAMTYGIQAQDNNPMTKFEKGIPLPASFLVDPLGFVRFTSRADRPGEIFNPEDIFPILEKITAVSV